MELLKFKKLLGIEGVEKDFELQFILDDVKGKVLDYCYLDEVPEGLETTCYRMAMDVYRNENFGNEEAETVVTSISEGDTSVSFKSRSQDSSYLESIMKDYRPQLNRYRKLVWK